MQIWRPQATRPALKRQGRLAILLENQARNSPVFSFPRYTRTCVKRERGGDSQEVKNVSMKVLRKKGDRSDCNSYRGISLVSHAGKVILKVDANRRSDLCDTQGIPPEERFSFRPKYSTVDMLFV